jgi:cell division protein FtsI (penicillin-binding protein 3)
MWIVFSVLVLLLGATISRLFYLQVLHYEQYVKFAQEQSRGNLLTLPVRGKIFDRNMNPFAESIDTKSVVMTASKFDLDSQSLQEVSHILGINLPSVNAENIRGSHLTYLKRKLTPEELASTQHLWENQEIRASGIFLIPDTKRFYPQQKLASHILGFTGLDEKGYDNYGLEGLEFHYDHYLRGHAERYSVPMDAKRNSLNSWALNVKNAGYNLVLTIDKNIQYMVERELEMTFREERARHAVVIVMNPHNGEILAMANYPDFNPNNFQNYPQRYYKNLAVVWDYEPGSTFKVIQTAAAFEEGILSPHDRLDNRGHFLNGASRPVSEWKELGYLSVEDILIQSNNVGATRISEYLGKERFYEYIKRFGFGELTGIDLPGEVTGKIRETDEWSNLSLQSLSIGQEISATPIQMANAFAVIANGGMLYTPHVVQEIQEMDGDPVLRIEPKKTRRVISPKTAQFLRRILAKVVEHGTGKRAAVMGYRVAGKTGTAQKFNHLLGDYSSTSLVTSFIGFAPAEYPQVVIAAIVDEPALNEWGGTVAAPLFKRIAERVLPYLDIQPDNTGRELLAFKKENIGIDD